VQTGRSTHGTMVVMPVWGTVLLASLAGWLLLSVLVALAVGRAIHLADRRSPRKRRRRTERRLRAVPPADVDDLENDGDRRRQPRG
jgi:uncharacterized protein (DUF2062 family)